MSGLDTLLGFTRYALGLSDTRKTARVVRFGVGITVTESDNTDAPEEVSIAVGSRIEDGFRVRMYLQNPPSFNEFFGGVTGISMATYLPLGISLIRTAAGGFLLQGLPTVTSNGVSYDPHAPVASPEFSAAFVAARLAYPNQIELRTYNTSGLQTDIGGLGVLLHVPYRRTS